MWFKPRTSQDIPYVNKDVIEREVKGNLDYLKTTTDTNTTGVATNVTDIATNTAAIAAIDTTSCVMRDGTTVAYASPTGTRVKDGVYRNTSGKIRFVHILAAGNADGATLTIKVGTMTPPTAPVVSKIIACAASEGNGVTFLVPLNYYYEASEDAGTMTIIEWTEWDIL